MSNEYRRIEVITGGVLRRRCSVTDAALNGDRRCGFAAQALSQINALVVLDGIVDLVNDPLPPRALAVDGKQDAVAVILQQHDCYHGVAFIVARVERHHLRAIGIVRGYDGDRTSNSGRHLIALSDSSGSSRWILSSLPTRITTGLSPHARGNLRGRLSK